MKSRLSNLLFAFRMGSASASQQGGFLVGVASRSVDSIHEWLGTHDGHGRITSLDLLPPIGRVSSIFVCVWRMESTGQEVHKHGQCLLTLTTTPKQ